MTYQNAIIDLLSLLYQERKLLAYVYEAKEEKRLFTLAELLPLCHDNMDRLDRLIQQEILLKRLGVYELHVGVSDFLGQALGDISSAQYLQFELDNLEIYLQGLSEDDTSYTISQQLSYALRKLEQGLTDAWKDWEKHPESLAKQALEKSIRKMRRIIWEDKQLDIFRDEELDILLIDLEELIGEVSRKLNKPELDPVTESVSLHDQVKHLKNLFAQGKAVAYTQLQVLLEDRPAMWLESVRISRPRIPTSQLYHSRSLEILQNIYKKKKKNRSILDASLSSSFLQVEKRGDLPWDLLDFKKSFETSDKDLFIFIHEYDFPTELTASEKLSLFLQLVDSFGSEWNQTETQHTFNGFQYPLIFAKH